MSIFQFVWQVIALCGLAAALVFGLFSAPWYVLGSLLLVTFVITWKLMPSQEDWVSDGQESRPAVHPPASPSNASHAATGPSSMVYRGAPHSPSAPTTQAAPQSSVLSYRGAAYAPKRQTASQPVTAPDQSDEGSHCSQRNLHELKYRGVKIQSSTTRPSN